MPILVGLYAEPGAPEAHALWSALTAGASRGDPIAQAADGPARVAIYPQHPGEPARCPDPRAPAPTGFPLGFGGDGAGTPPERLVPPWLVCRYDPARRALLLETDRHGFAIVYVRVLENRGAHGGRCVAFSTSAAALGRLAPRSDPDPSAIAELLAFDHLLGARTLRREVTAVPQGAALEIDARDVRFPQRFRYPDLPLDRTARRAPTAAALVPLWREGLATALRARGDAPVLVPLSGGLDSRLIAATALEAGARIEAFTFGREGTETPDVAIAREVARTLGASSSWQALPLEDDWLVGHARRAAALTDGQLDIIHAHGVSLTGAFPPGRLRLDGLAGDVVLGGSFLRPDLLAAASPPDRVNLLWRARARLDRRDWIDLLLPEARGDLLRRARASLVDSLAPDPAGDPRWSDFWVLRHRIRRFTLNGPLLWSAVARSTFPFFAPGFLDRLLAVDPRLRQGSALQADLLWRAWPHMAALPWQRTGRPVPRGRLREALARRLTPPAYPPSGTFFDPNAAFRASPALRAFLRDLLLDPTSGLARFGCFDRAAVARLLGSTEAGSRRGMPQIGVLATLVLAEELWTR